MENSITKTKKPLPPVNRVALTQEAATRLDSWIFQLSEAFHGIKIKRNDVVEWLIRSKAPILSDDEMKGLRQEHYSEVDLANWVLRQLKEAKAKGENLSLEEVVQRQKTRQ